MQENMFKAVQHSETWRFNMPDYKKMYTYLFVEITKVIEMLQAAQQETEEIYISEGGPTSSPSRKDGEKGGNL